MIKISGDYSQIKLDGPVEEIKAISEKIGYQVPNIDFIKLQYKRKYGRELYWDGFKSFITGKGLTNYGCLDYVIEVAKSLNIRGNYDKKFVPEFDENLYKSILNESYYINEKLIELRDIQKIAFEYIVKHGRCSLIIPTSSGKTLISYLCSKYYLSLGYKILIIVPNIALVDQGINDFISYGYLGEINGIKSGLPKITTDITISTFQSLVKFPHLTDNFNVVILDELHRIKSKSITTILKNSKTLRYRIGLTGTLKPGTEEYITASVYIGLPQVLTTTKQLISEKVVANLSIKIIRLNYKNIEKANRPKNYRKEKSFYNNHTLRTDTILKTAIEKNKTGMIAVNEIEHCQNLFNRCRMLYPERNVYQIRGGMNQRNDDYYKSLDELKPLIEQEKNAILIVGIKVFSTGISLKNIYFGIMAVTTKSYITIIQTIGRGLRVNKIKKEFEFIDILDDLRFSFYDETYAFNHYVERLSYYKEQGFKVEKENINLGF